MLCLEVQVGDEIQVGDVLIRTRSKPGNKKRTRLFIDAPDDMKITRKEGSTVRKRRIVREASEPVVL